MEKKIAKKTYEILKTMTFALRANVIAGDHSKFLPFSMSGKLCVARIPCERGDHVVWKKSLCVERVRIFQT